MYYSVPESEAKTSTNRSEDFTEFQIRRQRHRWNRWLPGPIVGSLLTLTLTTMALIVVVLCHRPSDIQCTRQLNMYCTEASYI
jgi:hypothetical protein